MIALTISDSNKLRLITPPLVHCRYSASFRIPTKTRYGYQPIAYTICDKIGNQARATINNESDQQWMSPSETNNGQFTKLKRANKRPNRNILIEHNYVVGKQSKDIPGIPAESSKISTFFDNSWMEDRLSLVTVGVLLDNLKTFQECG